MAEQRTPPDSEQIEQVYFRILEPVRMGIARLKRSEKYRTSSYRKPVRNQAKPRAIEAREAKEPAWSPLLAPLSVVVDVVRRA